MQKVHLTYFNILKKNYVRLKTMGHNFEICFQDKKNNHILIKKLNNDEYIFLPTGEILSCKHIKNRSESVFQVSQSLKRLRDYINTNVTEPNNCRWITLTYAENMTDPKRLYEDFKYFIKHLRRSLKTFKIKYIVAMEPQGRGAWHAHLILIFDQKAPYIPNYFIENLWGQGFTKTKRLIDIDNVGAYLTAYLTDLELTTENKKLINNYCSDIQVKEVTEMEGKKLKSPKKFIKGGRLFLYPPCFNLYRCSRGIKAPESEMITYENARKKIGQHEPIFSTALQLIDSTKDFKKTIAYEFYNTRRVPQN